MIVNFKNIYRYHGTNKIEDKFDIQTKKTKKLRIEWLLKTQKPKDI